MPNCPECVFKKRNIIIEEHKDDEDVNLTQLLDEVEVLMKFDPVTKHFICKRCGLYATREQVGDIRERINRKESTREDKQYDYLSWVKLTSSSSLCSSMIMFLFLNTHSGQLGIFKAVDFSHKSLYMNTI